MEGGKVSSHTVVKQKMSASWKREQLANLWDVDVEVVDSEIKRHFDNDHCNRLFVVSSDPVSQVVDHLVFNEKETIFSAWKKTSRRTFLEWAKLNGLDRYRRVMVGREFSDQEKGYILHHLTSDYVTLKLVRSFPASLKGILQWNDCKSFDELALRDSIKLFLKNAPDIQEWQLGSHNSLYSSKGERLYCQSPFKELILVNDGAYFCCSAWHGFPSLGDPRTQPLDEIWNSKEAIEFRCSILDGSYRYCRHDICPKLVNKASGLTSFSQLPSSQKEAVENSDGNLSGKFTYVNYGFDFSCNLSCPSCRTEVIIARGQAAEEIRFIEAQLQHNGQHLEELYISGAGDAFGSPYSRKFLNRINEENFPSLSSILIHSNGQLFNTMNWNKLSEFVRSRILYVEISIDAAYKETYEENRRGGSFERLLENLSFIKSLKESGYISYIKFSFVVQRNNYRQMPEFVDLALSYSADCVFFSKLMNWGTYSEKEYQERNVSNPNHIEFCEFMEILKDKRLKNNIVGLTNLKELVGS